MNEDKDFELKKILSQDIAFPLKYQFLPNQHTIDTS